jgi:hypothetical protein
MWLPRAQTVLFLTAIGILLFLLCVPRSPRTPAFEFAAGVGRHGLLIAGVVLMGAGNVTV